MAVTVTPKGDNVPAWESGPAQNAAAVTPNDSTEVRFRSLYIGAAGNVAVWPLMGDGATSVVFVGVPIGTVLPIAVRRVLSTGTTAGSIVGLV